MKNNITRRAFVGGSAGVVAAGLSAGNLPAAEAEPACTLENEYLKYVIGSNGRNLQFVDKQSGKDYCGGNKSHPAFSLIKDSKGIAVSAVTYADGLLTAQFGQSGATVVIRPLVRKHDIVMEVVSVSPEDVEEVTFADIPLTLKARPDEPFVACALALDLKTNVAGIPRPVSLLRAKCYSRFGCAGAKVSLIGCPADKLRSTMQEVVAAAKELPHSPIGGPWALGQEINQGSYLFNSGDMSEAKVDSWITLANTLGLTQIDFHGGNSFRFGDCLPNPKTYPNGTASFKAVIDKLHAAGIKAGLHTYAFFINKKCPWVTPVPDPRLAKDAAFTLTAALDEKAHVVPVAEPTTKMSTTTGFFVRNSVTVQIDDELITYGGISKEPPYAFTGCRRGACGTKVSKHKQGATVHHLKQCFGLFVPDPETTLLAEVAGKTAEMFNTCGFDMMYLDALDGEDVLGGRPAGWHYGSTFVFEIWKRLKKPALMEMSTFHHHLWYVRSRLGAWDHPTRSHKRFIDIHCGANEGYRRMFMPGHLGWWAVKTWHGAQAEPTFSDDIEYLMGKCLGLDVGMSLMGIGPDSIKSTPALSRLAKIIKRYEDLRHSGKVPEPVKARLRTPGEEFTLIGSLKEGWRFQPVEYAKHKVTGINDSSSSWQTTNKFGDQPLRLRIEALMAAGPYDAPGNVTLADFTVADDVPMRGSAPGVTATLRPSNAQIKVEPLSGCFSASHKGAGRAGTWARAEKLFEPTLNLSGQQALGVWVHGDGQQEVLNFQVKNPTHISRADGDHYVIVDFTGWRYFELIEPEGERHANYKWPYGSIYSTYRQTVRYNAIERLAVWYNNLPPGKQATCHISPIKAIPLVSGKLINPTVTIGGRTITFPVEISSGSYLELNGPTDCKLFGPKGEVLAEVKPQGPLPTLSAGANEVKFTAGSPDGLSARANVTIISQGKPLA